MSFYIENVEFSSEFVSSDSSPSHFRCNKQPIDTYTRHCLSVKAGFTLDKLSFQGHAALTAAPSKYGVLGNCLVLKKQTRKSSNQPQSE